MAENGTERTAVLVVGPAWWGWHWLMRDGSHTPLPDADTRAQRRAEADEETRGLMAALDALPADCVLVLAGDSKAVAAAHRWAERRGRQEVVVPNNDPPVFWPLVKATVLGLRCQGWKVKALACVAGEGDAVVGELRAEGLFVREVHPLPAPDSEPEPDDQPV